MGTAEFANQVLHSCASTNSLAKQLGEEGYPHGTWVSAREQTQGRGRSGNTWSLLPGGLALSIVLRCSDLTHWTWVPLTVAVACVDALSQLIEVAELRLKWPNDLFRGEGKAAGILCEGVGRREGGFIVAGIGINCGSAPQLAERATAAFEVDVDVLRHRVVEAVVEWVDELNAHGPQAIRRFYENRAFFQPGTLVTWQNATGVSQTGHVIGLGDYGDLRVQLQETGKTLSVVSDEVSRVRAVPSTSDGSLA